MATTIVILDQTPSIGGMLSVKYAISTDQVNWYLWWESQVPGNTVDVLGYLNAESDLLALPVGTRCRFNLYQDANDAFTQASLITDEASNLIANGVVWRVEALKLEAGILEAARQPPAVKNDQGDPEQPPDIGRAELRISPDTRIWKLHKRLAASDLAVGDLLLVNVTGERPDHPSRCTDVWVGTDTHKLVIEQQARKAQPPKR